MELRPWLRSTFAPPRFDSDADDRAASLVNALLWTIFLGAMAWEVFQVAAGIDATRIVAVGLVGGMALAGLSALHAKRLTVAAWAATSLVFGISCLSIWLHGRIDAPGATTFVVLIVMSAMALDWRPAALWTVLSIGALSLFAVAESEGWMPAVEATRPLFERWFIYAVHVAAAGWLVGHSAFAFGGVVDLLGERDIALRESEARLAKLVQESPDVIVAIDEDGVVTDCSHAIQDLFGYPASSVVGRSFVELGVLDEAMLERSRHRFADLVSGNSGALTEIRVLHRDGTPRWIEANPRVVPASDGRPLIYVVIRDVTKRHEEAEQRASLESQLVEARRLEALGRLAGGVAHDFNNLLLVILANAELLESDSSHPRERLIQDILTAGQAAADLTEQLLAFSGRQVPERTAVDTVAALTKIEGLLRRLIAPDVRLDLRLPSELEPARADPAQFEQVVIILVMNAQQAMPRGGRIGVELERVRLSDADCHDHPGASPGPQLRLAVSDEGMGMDDETARRIFEPFFSRREGGTGLGLATVHGVVTRAGGHVRVISEPGKGSTFEVYLPFARASESLETLPPNPADARRPTASRPISVLLVDDDERVRSALERLLDEHEIRVIPASSAEEAIAVSRAEPGVIDVLVTDLLMPGDSGWKLAQQLKTERPDMQLLLVSGYSPEGPDQVSIEGAHFMAKPFSGADLRDRIRELTAPS